MIEAMNAEGKQFDMHRLCALVEKHRHETPHAIQSQLMTAVQEWMVTQDDDISLVVARYRSP